MMEFHTGRNYMDWLSCPKCGSEDIDIEHTGYHEAIVECQECGAQEEGWPT